MPSTTVPVIFRCWPNGDVLALFPTWPHDYAGTLCTSYAHVGQHGAADYEHVLSRTRPASPDQYASLLQELRVIGYDNLQVYRRASHIFHKARRCVAEYNRREDARLLDALAS